MTWKKETVRYPLVDDTGAPDTGSHVVKLQPIDQAYPTGAISCSRLTGGDGNLYQPDSDLDETKHYDWYVDTINQKVRVFSPNSIPPLGG